MKKMIIGPVLVLLVASVSAFSLRQLSTLQQPQHIFSTPAKRFVVEQMIFYGDHRATEVNEIEVQEGTTALDVLIQSKNIEVKEYTYGKLIESIEGIRNGQDQKYWMYYINGKEASVGAAEYALQSHDKIEWKFKQYEE